MSANLPEDAPQVQWSVINVVDFDGIEMGVFRNGTTFMTQRGLAKACGISEGTLRYWFDKRSEGGAQFEQTKLGKFLTIIGLEGAQLAVPAFHRGQAIVAYPETICAAFMNFYARENDTAARNAAVLLAISLRQFIYDKTGYSPDLPGPEWKHWLDRVRLNRMPRHLFCVFNEMREVMADLIVGGLPIDSETVPDISVGTAFSNHWTAENLTERFGVRLKHPHTYPKDFRQAGGNGLIEAWAYPVKALGYFREWLYSDYIPNYLPKYLRGKIKQQKLTASEVAAILQATTPPQLGD